ncbi:unnamed protein product [Trichobilharzia regenti]|nr:unnamed protein product [Trichobilharzia regenti]
MMKSGKQSMIVEAILTSTTTVIERGLLCGVFGKASSKDSGVDSSAVLYPKQAVPPPVYTNLTQLTHAAQRKFSMSQLPIVHSYENVDNTLERLQYVKSDLKTNCHHFPHQLAHPNSIPTSTSQNQAMNSAQQINNATTTATATSNNTNGNWSVTSSLSKLNLNDSELNQSRGEEKYANPSGLLQSKVDKLSSNTSLSSSCFSSKHQLDGVSISGSTSVASGAVGNMPLLSNDGLTNSSRYSLCNSLYPASSESSVKEMSVNLIDHHHQSMNSPCFTNSQPPQPVPPSSSLSPPPPPPIQPKPLHLKHMQALSQYNLNKKSACLIRPCPPPRKCSVLTSQDCLMTSGVSMPCGLNTPDLSVYEGINNKYCQGNNFYEGNCFTGSLRRVPYI